MTEPVCKVTLILNFEIFQVLSQASFIKQIFKIRKISVSDDKHSVLESDRRRRRRESDARCRANLSSCFSFLRSQVQDKNENEVKMSKVRYTNF